MPVTDGMAPMPGLPRYGLADDLNGLRSTRVRKYRQPWIGLMSLLTMPNIDWSTSMATRKTKNSNIFVGDYEPGLPDLHWRGLHCAL